MSTKQRQRKISSAITLTHVFSPFVRFDRLLAAFVSIAIIVTLIPVPVARASSLFASANNTHLVKNITTGDSTNLASTNASPGDNLSFWMKVFNSGADAATGAKIVQPLTNYTYTPRTTRWAWNGASNGLNSTAGEVLIVPVYVDSDASGTITAGDIRVNDYGVNSASTAAKYASGSTVAGGEYDVGTALTSAVSDVYITGGNATWTSGEFAYFKGSGNVSTTDVETNDVRIVANGSYLKGSIVGSSDTDKCTSCLIAATNIKRMSDGIGETTWPFDGNGFPLGDVGVNKQILVKSTSVTLNMSVGNTVTNTMTVSATNGSSLDATSTVNVNTLPSVTAVSFSPGSITNDGASPTTVTVTATDKNGVNDVSSVTVNLAAIGGSSTQALTGNGSGTWTYAGITTTATAATYTITATATDATAQTATGTGTLIVQAGGTPTVTIASTSPTTVGASATSTVTWQANEAINSYTLRLGSCGGSAVTGTNVTATGTPAVGANTPVTSVIANANFSAGTNTIYICATDVDSLTGQNLTTITKDTTAPTVTVSTVIGQTITTGGSSTVVWSANESGTYATKVGSCSGATVTGTNASGSYTAGSGSVQSIVNTADLVEGANTIYACVTDAAGNVGSATGTVTRDTTAPTAVTGVSLTDADTTNDGVDGRDFTVSWTPAATDASFSFYRLYLLPAATTLSTATQTAVASFATQTTASWTGTSALTTDSAGSALAAGSYIAYVIPVDTSAQVGASAASSAATITLDDVSAPTFASATTIDANTLKIAFSEPISFVDTAKITATGITIDTTYNADSYTNGYKIQAADQRNLYLRIATIATSYTATNLALGGCAVRDLYGSSNLNEAGNCTNLVPSTNANAAVSSLSITDGAGPTITLTTPAASGTDNATIAVAYTLSEAALTGSVRLKFTATSGTADANSPHTIILTDAIVCASSPVGCALSAGSKSFTLAGGSFTSTERGASDTLVDGTIYTIALDASDGGNHAGTTATNTSWTYDTTAPSAPVTTQGFSSPTANITPTFTWGAVTGATSYTLQVSLQSTNYSPVFITQTQAGTSWQLSPAFRTAGLDDGTYIWRAYATDAAGNTSSASNQQTFVLDTVTNAPSIIIKDATSASATYTNSQTVNVTLDGYTTDATHYLLSESQSTQPLAAAITSAIPGAAPQTVSFVVSAGEVLKTIYVWVKDTIGNINLTAGSATITLDTTPPAQPTITVADANAGSQSGKTNAATISATISNDTGVAKWCVATGPAGFTATTPTESTCTTGQIGAAYASDWVTSRPTTATLVGTGSRDAYVWTQDAAGNVSTASTVATIDYETATPADPALSLLDQTTFSSSYTDSTTVDAITTNDATAWKWIVSTSQSSKPAENSGSWGAEPSTATISSGDGAKTVYVWVKDVYGNINANQSSATITLDTTKPTISTAKTQDLSADGQIDAIQITMSENITDASIVRTDWTLSGGYTTASTTGTLGSLTFTNGISTGSTANDAILYIAVTPSGATDTSAIPTLTYTAGSLIDIAGNTVLTASKATTDNVSPILTATNPIRVEDTNANGRADRIRVVYSEALAATTATNVWTLANVPSGGTISSATLGTTTMTNDTVLITLSEGSSAVDTTAGTATVALTNTGSVIADSATNAAPAFTATSATDYMGPVLVSANYISTGTLSSDSIIATFSEPILDSTIAALATTDFTIAGGGSITGSTAATGATAGDDTIVISDLSNGAPTVSTSTLRLAASGSVADASAQANTNTSIATITIRGGVVINEIGWAGMASVANDQYIELRNMSATSAIDFSTDNHVLCRSTTTVKALTTGTLAASSYFLVSNLSQAASAINVAPDLVGFTSPLLGASSTLSLTLRTGTSCTAGVTLDSAWNGTTPSIGANDTTIERNDSPGDGTSAGSWHAAVKTSVGFDDTTTYRGTPKAQNVLDGTAPTFDTATQSPAHQALWPVSPSAISVSYADNVGGVGVNTTTVTMSVDLNGDGDYADTIGGYSEGTSGICSGGALTTKSATRVVCTLPTALAAGRHSARVTVADSAGNSATSSWDFWVDNFTITIDGQSGNDLGAIIAGTAATTPDNTKHTKITVTTYGAAIAIAGTASGAFDSGAAQVPWHTDNSATAGTGVAYRVKEGTSGTFGNYHNWNAATAIASKAAITGASLASTNALQTYTFYVQYYVNVTATQAAGNYAHTISYTVAPTY